MPRLVCLLALCVMLTGPASATTHVVQPDGSGDFATIAAAISGAADGDIIELANGTFKGDGNRDIWIYNRTLTIRSQSGDPADCTIDPEGSAGMARRAFSFQSTSSSLVIENITFTGGTALGEGMDGYGGALLLDEGSSPTITGCIFTGNQADRGGAIFTYDSCLPAITGCTFYGNSAGYTGGAMTLNSGSNATITNCVFYQNSSDASGGALSVWGTTSPTITSCTLSRNTATSGGAGVACYFGGAPAFARSIIAFSTTGNAVVCVDGSGSPTFSCCNIYHNEGGDWVDCLAGLDAANDNFSEDPRFCDVYSGNFYLCDNSPCLAANAACGQLVGRYDSGCGSCQTPVAKESWGRLKVLYR